MVRNIMGTDYSHQAFSDIKKDLNDWVKSIDKQIAISQKYINELESTWGTNGLDNFAYAASRCKKLLDTAKEDILFVLSEIDEEVKENHIAILQKLGINGAKFNREIGQAKNLRYLKDGAEYSLYCRLRDSMINLTDLDSLAERLKDFVGKKKTHFPWGTIISNLIAFGALIVAILAYLK